MPDPAAFQDALTMLSELLVRFPGHPALLAAADAMDLPDELWLAVRIMSMSAENRDRLRDFFLIHQKASVWRVDGSTIAIIGGEPH